MEILRDGPEVFKCACDWRCSQGGPLDFFNVVYIAVAGTGQDN